MFARCINPTPSKSKQFNKGLSQLVAEGAVQQLTERGEDGASAGSVPILAAVGPLQLEVVAARLTNEYGVDVTFERLPFAHARWAMRGWETVDDAQADGKLMNVRRLQVRPRGRARVLSPSPPSSPPLPPPPSLRLQPASSTRRRPSRRL